MVSHSIDAYTNLVVFTTTSRDIIFSVSFPVVPLHPVQLFLRYYEVGGDGQVRDSSPSISYQNTSDINHIAFDPTVPFDKFRVEIFLYHQPQGVLGPGKNDTLVYGELTARLRLHAMAIVTCLISINFHGINT